MALESKPLFHPEVLRQQMRSFSLPDRAGAWQPKLQHWATLISSGRADGLKEAALLPEFLTDIFCGLLGYTGPAEAADAYNGGLFAPDPALDTLQVPDEVCAHFKDLGDYDSPKSSFRVVVSHRLSARPLQRAKGRQLYADGLNVINYDHESDIARTRNRDA